MSTTKQKNTKKTVTLENSTNNNLIGWYFSSKDDFHNKGIKKFYPFKKKHDVYIDLEDLYKELIKRESDVSKLSTEDLAYMFQFYHIQYDLFEEEPFKRNKKEFILVSSKTNKEIRYSEIKYFVRLSKVNRELSKRRIDLTKINTKQLLKWYRTNRYKENDDCEYIENHDFFRPYGVEDKTLITNVIEIKKELSKRENVPSKTNNKLLRQVCAKYKVNKEEALKLINKGISNDNI